MALHRFLPVVAYDPDTQTLVESALGYVYAIDDVNNTTPLDVYDSMGASREGNTVQVANGVLQEFQVHDRDVVRFVAGESKVPVWSPQSIMESAAASASSASTAAADAAGSVAGQIDVELAAKLKYAVAFWPLEAGQTEADLPPDFPTGPYQQGGPPPLVARKKGSN